MIATVQVADSVEPFDNQRQKQEQPNNQNAVGMVMADVLHTIPILGIVEALIFNLPATLGEVIQRETADAARQVG
jgi:ABC-type uncharacterized transport system YnjBCD ATPase subunit